MYYMGYGSGGGNEDSDFIRQENEYFLPILKDLIVLFRLYMDIEPI